MDDLNRTTEGDTQPIAHYDYDDNGNRVSYSDFREATPVVQNGTFDDRDRMLTYENAEDGYAVFAYSDNGELETKTLNGEVTDYEYDVLGNLKHVTLPDGMAVDLVFQMGRSHNGTGNIAKRIRNNAEKNTYRKMGEY